MVAHPLEHVEHREGVGEHRQCEIVTAQAKCWQANDDASNHADDDAEGNANPRGDTESDERDRHRVATETEKGRVTERDHAAVAAQHVPRDADGRPDQHQRHHQLIVGVANGPPDQEIDGGEREDREILLGSVQAIHHVRSQTRPNMPWGRKKMINRKMTNIAVFWSW